MFNAEAEADANNSLDGFETRFDGVPFLGDVVRAMARSQYDSSQPAAKVVVRLPAEAPAPVAVARPPHDDPVGPVDQPRQALEDGVGHVGRT